VSPILTRPIREQLEHDRVIRQLQARYKRKHDVTINPGPEQNQSVMVGDLAVYPDLLLFSTERSRRLEGTVEVETGESVNQLEALAEWGVFSKLRAPFYLYVPPQSIESARRICDEHKFPVAEIWTYHLSLDQVRFTQVYRSPHLPKPTPAPGEKRAAEPKAPAKASAKPAVKPVAPVKPSAPAKPAASPKSPKPTSRSTPARTAAPGKAPKATKATPVKTKLPRPAAPAKAQKPARAAKPAKGAKAARPAAKPVPASKSGTKRR
jgi:hypothetical protein